MHNPTHTEEPGTNGISNGIGTIVAGPIARSEADPSWSNVSREFQSFLTDIEELVKDATSVTSEDLTQAKLKLSARIASAKEAVEAEDHSIMQRAKHTAVVTDSYVRGQPWKAVGAGAAIAFLLGRLLTKRH